MAATEIEPDFAARLEAFAAARRELAALPSPARCKMIRVRSGASVREFARLLGVAPNTIVAWEAGTSVPRAENAERYRKLLEAVDRLGPPPRRKRPSP
jgi:DNA-binding transcriptional regulator YiaG